MNIVEYLEKINKDIAEAKDTSKVIIHCNEAYGVLYHQYIIEKNSLRIKEEISSGVFTRYYIEKNQGLKQGLKQLQKDLDIFRQDNKKLENFLLELDEVMTTITKNELEGLY
tara:strand:- start:2355 stop:2690 length:336 start_codon:yes stop_codon:yes gene_type:complete